MHVNGMALTVVINSVFIPNTVCLPGFISSGSLTIGLFRAEWGEGRFIFEQ